MNTSKNWQEPDGILQSLVTLVNEGRISLTITLIVNGTIVSGSVISGQEYTEAMKDIFALGVPDAPEDSASRVLEAIAEKLSPQLSSSAGTAHDTQLTAFIHLKDMRRLGDNLKFTDAEFPVWRVRLSAIDGWMIGG